MRTAHDGAIRANAHGDVRRRLACEVQMRFASDRAPLAPCTCGGLSESAQWPGEMGLPAACESAGGPRRRQPPPGRRQPPTRLLLPAGQAHGGPAAVAQSLDSGMPEPRSSAPSPRGRRVGLDLPLPADWRICFSFRDPDETAREAGAACFVAGSTPAGELGRVPLRAAQSIKMLSKKGAACLPFFNRRRCGKRGIGGS